MLVWYVEPVYLEVSADRIKILDKTTLGTSVVLHYRDLTFRQTNIHIEVRWKRVKIETTLETGED